LRECPVSVIVIGAKFQFVSIALCVAAMSKEGKSIGLCSTPVAQISETLPHSSLSDG